RLRQRGRRRDLPDLSDHRAGLPALRPAPRHRGRSDRRCLVTATTTPQTLRKSHESGGWGSPTAYLVAFGLVGVCLAPVLYIVLGGFRTNSQIIQSPAGLPAPWQIDNYVGVLTGSMFWQQMFNSLVAGIGTTVGVVVLGLGASYVIARYPFKAKE